MPYISLASFPVLDILRLIRSENVGAVTFHHLIRRYQSPAAALEAIPQLAKRGGMRRPITLASRAAAETELAKAEKFGARILLYGAADYPEALAQIHDAPPLLMLLGQASLWQGRRCLGFVGSRNASAGGCSLTRRLARDCGELGFTVVSGLARGIDAAAHQGALATGTVGVIAGGIDNIYPPENRPLFDQLAETGAILSENPFGAAPIGRAFPARNRIIAGICEGVLVVEATLKSGSLITADYALEQGREVMAIPGSPLDPRSHGPNKLIREGAPLIQSAEDIFRALGQSAHKALAENHAPEFAAMPPQPPSEVELDATREALLARLGPVPVHLDHLARETQVPVALLQSAALELELAGRLTRSAGGKMALTYAEDAPQSALL